MVQVPGGTRSGSSFFMLFQLAAIEEGDDRELVASVSPCGLDLTLTDLT